VLLQTSIRGAPLVFFQKSERRSPLLRRISPSARLLRDRLLDGRGGGRICTLRGQKVTRILIGDLGVLVSTSRPVALLWSIISDVVLTQYWGHAYQTLLTRNIVNCDCSIDARGCHVIHGLWPFNRIPDMYLVERHLQEPHNIVAPIDRHLTRTYRRSNSARQVQGAPYEDGFACASSAQHGNVDVLHGG
jgi:hypothetical protein